MSIIERLGEAKVLDLDGEELRLGSLWESQDLVLVFLRHYG